MPGRKVELYDDVNGFEMYDWPEGIYVSDTVTNVRDYGAKGDGLTDDTDAVNGAITAARNKTQRGGIIFFPAGVYVISSPILLPRTNATPTRVPHLIGESRFSSIIRGSNTFPTDRALVEWEVEEGKPALEQRIANLSFHLPNRAGIKAIHFAPTSKADYLAVFNERLVIEIEDIYITGHNDYHERFIHLEGVVWHSKINRIYGDPTRGNATYYTRLLEVDTAVESGTTYNNDAPGLCLSEVSHLYPMIRSGGWVTTFKGRCVNTTFRHGFCNGAPSGVYYDFTDSYNVKLEQLGSEGNGGTFIKLTNCHGFRAEGLAVGWPQDEGEGTSDGIVVVNSKNCVFVNRQAIPENAAYSFGGGKKLITVDEDCRHVIFRDWMIKPASGGTIADEVEILGGPTNRVEYINVNDYSEGIIEGEEIE